MTKHIIGIRSNSHAQEPKIPECLGEPVSITQKEMVGTDWKWTAESVAIITTCGMKTIDDQIEMFQRYHAKNILRPLQAGELAQMERHQDLWSEHWEECGTAGRIIFVGTVYTLHFEEGDEYDLVWYAWFDNEKREWVFDCALTTSLLWPNDLFACVAMNGAPEVEPCIEKPPLPPPRRDRETIIPREKLAIMR